MKCLCGHEECYHSSGGYGCHVYGFFGPCSCARYMPRPPSVLQIAWGWLTELMLQALEDLKRRRE